MKIKSFLVSMLTIAAFASCSNNDELDNLVPEPATGNAYLALSVSMPQGDATRADGGPSDVAGTADESTLSKIYVIGLKDDAIRGVYTVSSATAAAFPVAADINKIFVVANPSAKMLAQMNAAASYAALNLAIIDDITSVTKKDNFMMTSAGDVPADKGLVVVTPVLAASESTADIEKAKTEALASKATVKIDRVMSRVSLKTVASAVENGTATVDGWLLNTTNKNYYPYAELVTYAVTGTPAKYRIDTNYEFIDGKPATAIANAFNWLKNPDAHTWKNNPSAGGAVNQYCLENTMNVNGQVYGNTTKMVVKAKFAPTGVTLGNSWFRMGGVVYTFDQLKAIYADAKTAPSVKTNMDLFASKMTKIGEEAAPTAATFAALTLEMLDAIPNGGYKAVTIDPYLIEYFQKSVCYYDILIKHDNRVQPKLLGRWGVVRNNDYNVNITKISKPGLPYIPDPTDPNIKDPQNPDPNKPNDETSAFIAVEITVNPWTSWSQDNEL